MVISPQFSPWQAYSLFFTLRYFLLSLFMHRNFMLQSDLFVYYLIMGNEPSCVLLSAPYRATLLHDNSRVRSEQQNICLISISQQGPKFYWYLISLGIRTEIIILVRIYARLSMIISTHSLGYSVILWQ